MTRKVIAPPSSQLPPVHRVHEYPVEVLASLVEYLRAIYNPPVRGAHRVDRKTRRDTSCADADSDSGIDALDSLHADEFERAYAVRWLTGLVSRASLLQDSNLNPDSSPDSLESKVDALICSAAALIAICAGTAAARTFSRCYAFRAPSLVNANANANATAEVDVLLTDVPISADGESPTVGTQTWGSACLLAEMLVEDPGRFGLELGGEREFRVLELGAGTGLVSLALAKFLSARMASAAEEAKARVEIVASDYHPTVLKNLRHNIQTNFADGTPPHVALSAHILDWSTYSRPGCASESESESEWVHASQPPFDRPFDLILGADIVYEPAHALWIRDCASALLAHDPGGCAGRPRFHMIMPLRPTHTFESRTIEEIFLPVSGAELERSDLCTGGTSGTALRILSKETIVCEAEDTRHRAEVEYVHYMIGWA